MFQQMTEQVRQIYSSPLNPFYWVQYQAHLSENISGSCQVCDKCPNVKFEREGYFVTVDIEKGMKDGEVSLQTLLFNSRWNSLRAYCYLFQEVSFYEDGEPILDGEPGDLKVSLLP